MAPVLSLVAWNLLWIPALPAPQTDFSQRAQRASGNVPSKRALVIVVGGVGGIDIAGIAAQWSLPRAGIHAEIREFRWTHGRGHHIRDLQDTEHYLQKAAELALEINQVQAADPDRPIYLVGKSGGTGIVLAAAEQLPPASLERIVLLSAAVAPTYDLRPALRATKHEVVAFYSPFDLFVLGWGTKRFGTMDRYYGSSAGLRGFVVPAGLTPQDRLLYDRLVQLPWTPSMIWEGNTGGHLGTSMPAFMAKEVAPWLKP
jgi:pimeloyl-ACP methyl ester carboxylesterase